MTDIAAVTELLEQVGTGADSDVQLLLRRVPPAVMRMLRLCAIPHSFNQVMVRLLDPELDETGAGACIDTLANLSIIGQAGPDFYVHDRARDVLFREWLSDQSGEFALVSGRLHEFFKKAQAGKNESETEVLKRNSVFHLMGADPPAGMKLLRSLFDVRYDHMRYSDCDALVRLAREYDPALGRESRLALALMEGLVAISMRDSDRALQPLEEVAAEAAGPDRVEALLALARLLRQRKQFGRAAAYLDRGFKVAESTPDTQLFIARLMLEDGLLARDRYQPDKAEMKFRKAAVTAKRFGALEEFADAENALGNLLRRRGDSKNAIKHFLVSLKCLDPATQQLKRARIFSNVGVAYSDISEWEKSEQFLKESWGVAVQSGDYRSQGRVLNNFAKLFLEQDKLDEATTAYRSADAIFMKLSDYRSAAIAMSNLCRILAPTDALAATEAMKAATERYRMAKNPARALALEREFYRRLTTGQRHNWLWKAAQLLLVLVLLCLFVLVMSFTQGSTSR